MPASRASRAVAVSTRQVPADTKTRILSAALDVFAERGFSAATTAHIARHAGIAEKTLFAHFKTKDALFEQVLTPSMLALLIPGAEEPRELFLADWDTLESFMTALMRDRLEFYRQHPREFKLVVQELLLRPELGRQFIAGISREVTAPIEKALSRLRSKGELSPVPLARVHRIAVSVLLGYAISRLVLWPEREWDDDAEVRAAVSALTKGLRPRSPLTPTGRAEPKAAPKRQKRRTTPQT